MPKPTNAVSGATPGPWYWLGDGTLVAGHGHRPVIITAGRTSNYGQPQIMERDPVAGRLVPLDISGPNALLLASAPALARENAAMRDALAECVESLARLDDKDGAYRVTVLQQARAALAACKVSK